MVCLIYLLAGSVSGKPSVRGLELQYTVMRLEQRTNIMWSIQIFLASPFAKFPSPVLILLQPCLANTWPDRPETGLEIYEHYRSNILHCHVEESLPQ